MNELSGATVVMSNEDAVDQEHQRDGRSEQRNGSMSGETTS